MERKMPRQIQKERHICKYDEQIWIKGEDGLKTVVCLECIRCNQNTKTTALPK